MFQANAFQVNAFQIGDVAGIAPPFVPPASSDSGGPQGGLKKRRRRRSREYYERLYDLSEGFSGRPEPMGEDDEPATIEQVVEALKGEAAPDTALADALRAAIGDAKARGRQIDAEQIERLRLQLEEEELEELLLLIAAM